MTLIELDPSDMDAKINSLAAMYPDYPTLWAIYGHSSDAIDYPNWDADKIWAWDDYCSLRWLRGDNDPAPREDD